MASALSHSYKKDFCQSIFFFSIWVWLFGKRTKSFRRIGTLKNKIPHFVRNSSKEWTHSIFFLFRILCFYFFITFFSRFLFSKYDDDDHNLDEDNGRNTQRQESTQKSRMTNCHYTYPVFWGGGGFDQRILLAASVWSWVLVTHCRPILWHLSCNGSCCLRLCRWMLFGVLLSRSLPILPYKIWQRT